MTGRQRDERGFSAVETAIAAPVLILVLLLVVAAGRVARAGGTVDAAAYAAARAASITRTAGAARAAADATAASTLSQQDLSCSPRTVTVDTGGFAAPVGTTATVTVAVACTVGLSDLSMVPGLGGGRTVTAHATSVLDTYRGRAAS